MLILRQNRYTVELRHTFRLSRGATDTRHNVLIEIEHDGIVGLGEAAPIPRYHQSPESAMKAIEAMVEKIDDPHPFDGLASRVAVAGEAAAEAAVDMALRDLAGKRLGAPLWQMAGVDPSTMPPTSFTIGIDEPSKIEEKVREADGFEVLKIKLGSEDDRAILEAVRRVTDVPVRIDANEGWTLEEARRNLDWLEELGVELVEQPLPADRLDDMRELKRISPLPLIADESIHRASDIPELADAFHGINIKLMKCGGPGEARRMIDVARAHGMQVMLGCMVETSLAITAAAQLAPLVDFADLDGALLIGNDPFMGARLEAGRLVLPDEPGLGVRPRS